MPPSLLTLGYSPCPNDTFIFEAIANRRVGIEAWRLEPFLADVEVLNHRAQAGELDVTKLSFHALAHCLDRYWLLRSGGALGRGCGPLLVARTPLDLDALRDQAIAIPGRYTTAHLLLELLGSHRGPRPELPFEQIMPAVAAGQVAAGLVIHEGRFTYRSLGLHPVLDLGAWWEQQTGLPLPLGCIVIRRDLGTALAAEVDAAIRASLLCARAAPQDAWPYIKAHAQELDDAVIRSHIDTFVNDYSLDVGTDGKRAVRTLLEIAAAQNGLPPIPSPLYWDEAPEGAPAA